MTVGIDRAVAVIVLAVEGLLRAGMHLRVVVVAVVGPSVAVAVLVERPRVHRFGVLGVVGLAVLGVDNAVLAVHDGLRVILRHGGRTAGEHQEEHVANIVSRDRGAEGWEAQSVTLL